MRVSLLATILAMGVLGMLLALEAGRIYREHAVAQQREATAEQLRLIVHDLRRELETRAREFSASLYRDPAFLAAVQARQAAGVTRFLDRQFRQPALAPSETRLEKIYVYDAQHQLIASAAGAAHPTAPPPCQSLQALAARRKPVDRLKPLSGICVADRQPYYAVVLPLGEEARAGFLHLVMELTPSLAAAENALGMPIRLAFGDGSVIYRSPGWPRAHDPQTRVVVDYSLYAHADTKAYMNLSASRDMRAFYATLAETQRLLLLIAAITFLFAILVVFTVLQKTAIVPLRALTDQLRRLRQDKRHLGELVRIGGNAEMVELGEGFNEMSTRLHGLYQNMEALAFTDPLTQLSNRAFFQEQLAHAIATARRDRQPFALFIMDLDHFKEINDTLGHHIGDLLLAQVASRLHSRLRETDLIARMGGDEFALLLPAIDSRQAATAAKLLLQALHDPFMVEEQSLTVGASIGIALHPDHGVDTHTLIQRADVAMYAAKRVNNGYAFYDPKLDRHSPSRFTLLGELRQALEKRQFVVYYQPKISLATSEVTGVEALVRWQHPRDGLVLPDVFIPLMEQTGLLRALTPWVLAAAMQQCRALQDLDIPVTVSINLSVRDLQDPQLVDTVAEQLAAHQVNPQRLEIEVTESALMSERERAQETLVRLSEMGLKVAIDDFGTGYSSLAYLKSLPVDVIKIDRSFVTAMARNENDAAIVHASIDLAHHLDLEVVAEGVETEEVLRRLQALGCDGGQGLYISRPLSAEDLLIWLQQSSWGLKKCSAARVRRVHH